MRDIKFRVWSKTLGRFLSKEEYCLDLDGGLIFVETHGQNFQFIDLKAVPPQNYTIQQFTGLKDKNEKEIYEGDIILFESGPSYFNTTKQTCIAPVVFSPFGCGFVLDSSGRHAIGDEKYGDCIPIIRSWAKEDNIFYTVLGNIFENPELLKP